MRTKAKSFRGISFLGISLMLAKWIFLQARKVPTKSLKDCPLVKKELSGFIDVHYSISKREAIKLKTDFASLLCKSHAAPIVVRQNTLNKNALSCV